jgi:hypothetical protein
MPVKVFDAAARHPTLSAAKSLSAVSNDDPVPTRPRGGFRAC